MWRRRRTSDERIGRHSLDRLAGDDGPIPDGDRVPFPGYADTWTQRVAPDWTAPTMPLPLLTAPVDVDTPLVRPYVWPRPVR